MTSVWVSNASQEFGPQGPKTPFRPLAYVPDCRFLEDGIISQTAGVTHVCNREIQLLNAQRACLILVNDFTRRNLLCLNRLALSFSNLF